VSGRAKIRKNTVKVGHSNVTKIQPILAFAMKDLTKKLKAAKAKDCMLTVYSQRKYKNKSAKKKIFNSHERK